MKKLFIAAALLVSVSMFLPSVTSAMGQETLMDSLTGITSVSAAGYGSSGANVTAIQRILYAHGFLKVSATGYFGSATRTAVTAFQKANGLALVGNVGPKTAALLWASISGGSTTDATGESGVSAITGTSTTTPCLPTTAPWIAVVSPNGGEMYHAGDMVTVKWQSCNLPSTDMVNINLMRPNLAGGFDHVSTTPDASNQFPVGSGTGSATITLTEIGVWPATVQLGSVYKILLDVLTPSTRDAGSIVVQDWSDTLFSIN